VARKATNPQNLIPFKKGDPRINRKGRPGKIPALDVLLGKIPEDHYQAIIDKLSAKARAGDVRAAEVVLDRAYGKPNQKMQIEAIEDQIFVIGGREIKF